MSGRLDWHKIFGLMLTDYFEGTGYTVELEMDLSLKRQLLDIVVVRSGGVVKLDVVCDGFEELGPHNLITYKSMCESLTAWSLDELVGHYVNYRKRLGLSKVGEDDIRLYAVCTRFPKVVAGHFPLLKVKDGVFDMSYGSRRIRVIVLPNIGETSRNAIWELFSADRHKVEDGARQYHFHMNDLSTVIDDIFKKYNMEGIDMAYTVEQYKKDYLRRQLKEMSLEEVFSMFKPEEYLARLRPEKVLALYKPEERLAGLRPEERLAGLRPEERLAGLRPEERLAGLSPEERLAGLSPEFIKECLASQNEEDRTRKK